uniref:Flavin-containing monooxygenase n=1 Tax=Ciona savignyi TaxID=51511 RepID=H2ZGS1_CIOSA
KKRVCVIGAGASGLTAIKCCIDEGLEPVCFEKSHDIGGLWRYEEKEKEGACVYNSTIINTSKEMMCYSDCPIPDEFPNYMHNTKIMEYFGIYAKKFNLMKHINFNTSVLSCEQEEKGSGEVKVKIRNEKTKETSDFEFDAVLVCVGHHADPYYPLDAFPGIEKFKGEYFHSHEYRKPQGYEGKRVLIVGVGNSGGDIAVELSRQAKQLYWSTRRGCWVMNRVSDQGLPVDIINTTRITTLALKLLPISWINNIVEKQLNARFDHQMYGLKPKHRFTGQHPTINDDVPNQILSGRIIMVENVAKFTEHEVEFKDGRREEIDVVVFATGYRFRFPFLSDSILEVNDNKCRLYKHMWPSSVKNNSLAIIGGIQPLGAINPISEMQCRWACRVFKGRLNDLPRPEVMDQSIDEQTSNMAALFYKSPRHTIQADHVAYMDEIADQIGVKPNMFSLFITDRKLARKVWYEFCSGYQYRLKGPGKWAGAREAIMGQKSRMFCPLHTRATTKSSKSKKKSLLSYYWLVAVAIGAFYVYR